MRFRFAALLCALIVAPALSQQAPLPPTDPGAPPAGAVPDPVAAAPGPDTSVPVDETAAAPTPPELRAGEPAAPPAGAPDQGGEPSAPEADRAPDGADATPPDAGTDVQTLPPAEARRVVVLQPEFRVFVQSAGGMREIEPGWTEQAQNALALAVERHLRHDPRFAVAAPVEPATAEEASLLREHVELFKVIASNSSMMIRFGGKAWQEKKLQYDYTLGDGLALYGDRSNADYAFMIGGAQVKQTGGSVFMQLALAGTLGVVMPGGGTYLMLALVDMRTGDIVWFNSLEGGEVFGMSGSDLRKEGTADEIVGRLFDPFPASSLFNTKIF